MAFARSLIPVAVLAAGLLVIGFGLVIVATQFHGDDRSDGVASFVWTTGGLMVYASVPALILGSAICGVRATLHDR